MANNLDIKDGNESNRIIKTTDNAGVHTTHHIVDSAENVEVTALPAVNVAVLPTLNVAQFPEISQDSFGRLRTSDPAYRFDAQLTYQINNDVWDTSTTNGTVTHSATERWAALSCNASGANKAILQSHYHAPYTPGRGQLAFITFLMGAAPAAGGVKRAGYYDGTNGIYLERNSADVRICSISSTSHGTEAVVQANWNIDTMDGTGPSGITLDLTKMQILVIQLQALYVGRVVVAFDIGGKIVPVHQFNCANFESVPYIAQASLPIRYEVISTVATGTPVVMHAVCASVISEGGTDLVDMPGRTFTSNNGVTAKTGILHSARTPLLSIQCAAQLNSINQNALVIPLSVEVLAKTTDCLIEVIRNGTLTGASFAAVDAANSTVNRDVTASAIANGTVVDSFYAPVGAASLKVGTEKALAGKVVLAYSHLLAAGDILTVCATRNATSGGCEAQAALKWKEVR